MNEDIIRTVTIRRGSSTPDGTFSLGQTDNGFKFVLLEKPWANDKEDVSCIPPAPGESCRYPTRWQWSEKHQRELYHILDIDGRNAIEIHAANVQEQLLGCGAPGARIEMFLKGSIGPNMPSRDTQGVMASVATLSALHAALLDKGTREQMPFWLEIS